MRRILLRLEAQEQRPWASAVDALLAAAEHGGAGRIYNVGSGGPVSVNTLVRLLGSPPTVRAPKRPGEPDCTWADISRIREELGWAPKVSVVEGVGVLVEHAEYWRDAPVWTPASIEAATADWFTYLDPALHPGARSRGDGS